VDELFLTRHVYDTFKKSGMTHSFGKSSIFQSYLSDGFVGEQIQPGDPRARSKKTLLSHFSP